MAWLFLAFALRMVVPVAVGPARFHERGYDYYVEMADNLLAGRGLHRTLPYGQGDRHAIRTPGYPLVLAAMRAAGGPFHLEVALFGAACGTLTVLATWWLARSLFGPAAGRVASVIAALWPHAVVHDAALQDTALYTALFMTFACALRAVVAGKGSARLRASTLGAAGAVAVLVRAPLAATVGVLLAWAALLAWRRRDARLAATVLSAAVLAGALPVPWLWRNDRVVGAPVLTTDVGRSFWLGNNPQTFSVYPRRSIDRAEERAWAALSDEQRAQVRSLARDELAADAWFMREGLRFVREQPAAAALGALRKAWASFSPWWNPEGGLARQLAHLGSYGPVLVLAMLALVRERERAWELLPILLALAMLALQSAVFFGHSAYRAYVDPLLVVLASSVVASWLERRRS